MGSLDYIRHGTKRRILAIPVPTAYANEPRRFWVTSPDLPRWIASRGRSARYILNAVLSASPWVRRIDFRELEAERDRLTKLTGIPHELDHDIPLSNPRVCGLTVPANMKAIPRGANSRKGNAWCQWHGDLFSEPEQFNFNFKEAAQ